MKEEIRLSDHFGFKRLFRFVLPSVVMAVFTSVYTIVDGLFVANLAGDTAFAGLNLIFPALQILGAIGLMFGSGGSALIARTLGEGDRERANGYFSLFVVTVGLLGAVFGAAGYFALPSLARLLGSDATAATVESATAYGKTYLFGMPFLMLQFCFQSFFITAEKPRLGFFVTVAAGAVNAVLDYVFIGVLEWGVTGAAAATVIGQAVGGILPLVYFCRRNSSLLRLTKPCLQWKPLFKAAANGSSELLANISVSIVSILYNFELLRLAGDDGVIAYGVIMYVLFIFFNILFGYFMGVAPVVSYHYGAGNRAELKNLRRKSLLVAFVGGAILTALAEGLAEPLTLIFVREEPLVGMTVRGLRLYSLDYLFLGCGIFGSAFFTALNNGGVSAGLSFLRTLVLPCITILTFPLFGGLDGIWLAAAAAEVVSAAVTLVVLRSCQKRYGY